jgi:hypothetical protein
MRKYFMCVQLFAVMGLLTSCLEVPSTKTETPKMPEIKFELPSDIQQVFDMLAASKTCDKKDSEQPQVSNEVLVSKFAIEDQIETQNAQVIDCDNKVKSENVGPVRRHSSFVKISAPEELVGPVNYVSVENHRTCETVQIKANAVSAATNLIQSADLSGNVNLNIMESNQKVYFTAISVHEGNNVLTVRYYGKCLVYKKEVKPKLDDSSNCEKAEELGSKMAYVELHITRPLIDGTRRVEGCFEPKK